MPFHKVSPADLRRAFLAGRSYAEVSKAFGVGRSTAWRYKRVLGLTGLKCGRKIDPEKLRELHAAGWTRKQAAGHFGCSIGAICQNSARLKLRWRKACPLDIAEWVTWDKPQPGAGGVVDRDRFIEIFLERGIVGTAHYLNLSASAVSQRACRLRAKGLLP